MTDWLTLPGAAEILAFLLTEEPRAMPRPDPATRGRRERQTTVATRLALDELYPEMMRPLAPVFGRERAAEIVLDYVMSKERAR